MRHLTTSPGRARRSRATRVAAAAATVLALSFTAACGGGSDSGKKDDGPAKDTKASISLPNLKGKTVQVAAVWTGPEQKHFQKVLDQFAKLTGAKVQFVPTGDNVATFLGTKIEGGAPPDVAMLPQVGVLHQFADKGYLKPLGDKADAQLKKNYAKAWQDLGAYKGKQYGVYVKAANKSLVWYNNTAFQNAGVSVPKTWKDFLSTAQTISDSGVPPVSVGGADGWTLTDWFENVYLSQAGPQKYDELAAHKIKWTDSSVTKALTTLGQLFGKDNLLAGGRKGSLQTAFPESVTKAFSDVKSPKAAMVYEGDFVAVNIADTNAKIGTDAKVFPFPAVGSGKSPVVTGGDVAVALKDNKAAQAMMTYLASTDAAKVWAQQGGYISPNKSLEMSAYPNDTQRTIAKALIDAGNDFRFDMSDQAPAAFGGTKGSGEWKILQDFLKNPKDVKGTQQQLEKAAAKDYKN
jgi:alpha-glucoside transport system substrate-binding protein